MAYRTLTIKCWFYSIVLFLLISCDTQGNTMKASDFFDNETQALINAVQKGQEEDAQALLQEGVSFNRHGKDGITPLFYLLIKQDKPAMRLALALGADPDFAEPNGNTPVAMASGAIDDELLEILLEGGGDPNSLDHNGYPAIFGAIGEERLNQVNLLIKNGADINLRNESGEHSLLHASYLNKYQLIYFLIDKGVDITYRDEGDVDIAWQLHDKLTKNRLSPEFPAYEWALKVRQQLIDRGVEFPPLSPLEVRHQENRLDSIDIELLKERQDDNSLDDIDRKILNELDL